MLENLVRFTIMSLVVALLGTTWALAFDHLQDPERKLVSYQVLRSRILNGRRSIDILIDEKDFTVENLKNLLTHFSSANAKPQRLWVFVATDRSQVYDFAEYSNPERARWALHPYGGLHREKDKDFIRYRFPGEKLQTLVIKAVRGADKH